LHFSPVGRTDTTRRAWPPLEDIEPEALAPAPVPVVLPVVPVPEVLLPVLPAPEVEEPALPEVDEPAPPDDELLPAPPAIEPVTSTFWPTYC